MSRCCGCAILQAAREKQVDDLIDGCQIYIYCRMELMNEQNATTIVRSVDSKCILYSVHLPEPRDFGPFQL